LLVADAACELGGRNLAAPGWVTVLVEPDAALAHEQVAEGISGNDRWRIFHADAAFVASIRTILILIQIESHYQSSNMLAARFLICVDSIPEL